MEDKTYIEKLSIVSELFNGKTEEEITIEINAYADRELEIIKNKSS